MPTDSDIIKIEILGTLLQLRGGENEKEVLQAAEEVRERVNTLHERAPTAPSLQIALLAAINLAYELHQQSGVDSNELDAALHKANEILGKTESAST